MIRGRRMAYPGPIADCHTHLLAGLDDGPQELAEAGRLLQQAAANGTRLVFLTPHYLPGHFTAGPEEITKQVQSWQEEAAGLGLQLAAGQEAYLDAGLPQAVRAGNVLTLGGSSCLLVELPLDNLPPWADELLFQLQLAGVTPVLAHPERCAGLFARPEWLGQVVGRGLLVQLNGPSLTGAYGSRARKLARDFLRRGWVHLLGSDAHSVRRPPDLRPALEEVRRLVGEAAARRLAWDNPLALLAGGEIAGRS